jgi:hypothetical protein
MIEQLAIGDIISSITDRRKPPIDTISGMSAFHPIADILGRPGPMAAFGIVELIDD